MLFAKLGLSDKVLEGVKAAGYTDPTPIQLRAIPLALEGRDLIGSAQTGTGKTAAFALPIISQLGQHGKPRALVLEPTREFAAQVETAFHDYSRFTDLVRSCCTAAPVTASRIKRCAGTDIVVATPGPVARSIAAAHAATEQIEILVLDEADRMLDMGFMPDVRKIVERVPKTRQTLLFSATIPPEIERWSRWAMKNPETIQIGQRRSPAANRHPRALPRRQGAKTGTARRAAAAHRIRSSVDLLPHQERRGPGVAQAPSAGTRGGRAALQSHPARARAGAQRLRNGRYEVMVATDIAARGIDVEQISHVINYDVPHHPEDYVHRSAAPDAPKASAMRLRS